ncbi:hypothetical protein [Novosphingobium sp.]|uniref:hypothetical protein n=1 Tax=Novosphingobium sp. TaxID=1874826 RepID=UPI0026169FFF|nr:hypothetical protein [Novosphingobium sp.]
MSTEQAAIEGAQAAHDAARDWQAVHSDASIQYAPLPELSEKAAEPPVWLKALGELLRDLFEPIGRAFGMSWEVLKWVLIGIGALILLYVLWQVFQPLIQRWRLRQHGEGHTVDDPEWAPGRQEALALLEDADRLAAEGRFDEATHLLLHRSVRQIAAARPDWVHPASTAREIAAIGALPDAARQAFALIAARVERSFFALGALSSTDWQAARDAYAEFALQRLPGRGEAAR